MNAQVAKKAPCDCLNKCGDDPWLKNGKAYPCKSRLRADEARQAAATRQARIKQALADSVSFISGFEEDEIQEGVPALLQTLRGLLVELEPA